MPFPRFGSGETYRRGLLGESPVSNKRQDASLVCPCGRVDRVVYAGGVQHGDDMLAPQHCQVPTELLHVDDEILECLTT